MSLKLGARIQLDLELNCDGIADLGNWIQIVKRHMKLIAFPLVGIGHKEQAVLVALALDLDFTKRL